jgi:DNA-binding transcriptional regulator YhcF (GntR family)
MERIARDDFVHGDASGPTECRMERRIDTGPQCIIVLIHFCREGRRPRRSKQTSTVQIHISTHDGVPVYLQIVNQVKYLVASGRLAPGEELPPIRVLAEQLVINPNTVARAYLELERAGLVVKRHGSGTYVSDEGSPLARRERLKILTQRADALLAEARHMGVDFPEVVGLLKERNQALNSSKP